MRILGISGGFDSLLHGDKAKFKLNNETLKDSSAVLLQNGEVLYAIREERLNRVPRTNVRPVSSIERCLRECNLSISDIDKIAVCEDEKFYNFFLQRNYLARPDTFESYLKIKDLISNYLNEAFNYSFDVRNIEFVKHQQAHAMSAFACSGYDNALVLSLDSSGDGFSGIVAKIDGQQIETLHSFPDADSLVSFCQNVMETVEPSFKEICHLWQLAVNGDASMYRSFMRSCYELFPNGSYKLRFDRTALYEILRQQGGHASKVQLYNIAAALQEMMECVVIHVITHFQQKTAIKHFCFAGELAENAALNGKLLCAGLFEDLFIQPIADDAGAALGAALTVFHREQKNVCFHKLRDVYWGSCFQNSNDVLNESNEWGSLIEAKQEKTEVIDRTARMILDGQKVGWLNGRAEFVMHSVGNRSIFMDPRRYIDRGNSSETRGYVCKWPTIAIREDALLDYFEIPPAVPLDKLQFGNYALGWKAGVHQYNEGVMIRVQSVNFHNNPTLWELLNNFEKGSGLPFLFQSDLCGDFEPMVESLNDAIAYMLTSDIDCLVIGDVLCHKLKFSSIDILQLLPTLPHYVHLQQKLAYTLAIERSSTLELVCHYNRKLSASLSPETHRMLMKSDASRTMLELFLEDGVSDLKRLSRCSDEILQLWTKRLLLLEPIGNTGG